MVTSEAASRQLVVAATERSRSIVESLSRLDDDALRGPSELPEWSRLTIACHLRFGAGALARMTRAAVQGVPVAYYPGGREVQRPKTLVPSAGESPQGIVSSLAGLGEELNDVWTALDSGAWDLEIVEPQENPDLGRIPLGRLPLLRLTEVEVHGTDLGLGLSDWSELFVRTALPMRLEWLNVRRANHRAFDPGLTGSWLLVASDGPTYKVNVDGANVESRPAPRDARATASIEASSRDLLALLLGRALDTTPVIAGDIVFAQSFARAFPGP